MSCGKKTKKIYCQLAMQEHVLVEQICLRSRDNLHHLFITTSLIYNNITYIDYCIVLHVINIEPIFNTLVLLYVFLLQLNSNIKIHKNYNCKKIENYFKKFKKISQRYEMHAC